MTINSSLLSSIDYSSQSINKNETIEKAELIDENSLSELPNDQSLFGLIFNYLFHFHWIKQFLNEEQHILEYSLEYGFLRLPPQTRQKT
ncbi:unnamed protein product [Rotaria sp. Silwood1]|nr:unnamed protein product [Rotaria sp. Silwood1]CAF1603431.1 unnamed protein product [Rotaria sp. Silwood1]